MTILAGWSAVRAVPLRLTIASILPECSLPACSNRRLLICPTQERRADRETRSHRREQHQAPFFQSAFLARCFHGQGNRSGSSVSVALNVNDHGFGAHVQTIGSRG